jgi:integrase
MDFTSQDYLRNPAAGIERLRSSGPVVQVRFPIIGRTWITTTQEAAARMLKDNSHAIDEGAPITLVSQTLGHADLKTTSVYAHAKPNDSSSRYLKRT